MPFTPRKLLPHEVPSWVETGSLYFFTLCVRDRLSTDLTSVSIAPVLLSATQHYHEQASWYARLFLVMPDHVHALIVFPINAEIRATWRNWKRYTSRTSQVNWQRDYFEHRLRSDESLDEKAHYIRENPVRKGLVAEARLWPWVFEGWRHDAK